MFGTCALRRVMYIDFVMTRNPIRAGAAGHAVPFEAPDSGKTVLNGSRASQASKLPYLLLLTPTQAWLVALL